MSWCGAWGQHLRNPCALAGLGALHELLSRAACGNTAAAEVGDYKASVHLCGSATVPTSSVIVSSSERPHGVQCYTEGL